MNTMMTLQDAALAVKGTLSGKNVSFSAVSTDSRTVSDGQLFIALSGEHFDGHAFIETARDRGAVAAMVSSGCDQKKNDFPLIVVDDTRLALGQLAAHWRARFSIPIVAVTGSNGKTTNKEMIASILRAAWGDAILATEGNLNNDIGLPLTLLKLNAAHRAAVIEMGMNHPGEIVALARISQPTVAIVTNAQRAHLEGMGSLETIAAEKGSVFTQMPESGSAVINADDQWSELWQKQSHGRRIMRFSFDRPAEVFGHCTVRALESLLTIRVGDEQTNVILSVPGRHNARNALGAATAALAAGATLSDVHDGLSVFCGVRRRLQRRNALHEAVLLDDTYNANPDSVRAGIDVLASVIGKKILVLGDMGEIGKMTNQFHDEIGCYAKSQGIDMLLALGDSSALAVRNFGSGGRHFRKIDTLIDALKAELTPQTTVLVKGSRFMRMERAADAIAAMDTETGVQE